MGAWDDVVVRECLKETAEDEWRPSLWGELATLEYGKSLRGYNATTGPYEVYGTNGPIGRHSEALCPYAGVIIGRKGAYRGVHYSPDPFFVIDTAFYLKPKVEMDTRWAYYQLLTQDINGMDSGSAIPSTSREDFYSLPVDVPPLPEQRAIAHVLGTLDDKIELNRRMNETLEEMARALFKSWFVDFDPVRAKMEGRWRRGESLPGLPADLYDLFPDRLVGSELGEIPEGWEVKALGELCTLRAGSAFPKASQGKTTGKYPFVKVRDMNLTGNSVGILDATNWVDDDDMKQLKGHHFPRETTVFAKIGEGLKQNRIRTLTRPTLIDNNMMGAVPNTDIIKPLILFHVLSQFDFGEIAGGTALPYLTAGALRSLLVPVPHLKKQIPLSDSLRSMYDRLIANEIESRSLAEQRDVLLPKLVSGKVRTVSTP